MARAPKYPKMSAAAKNRVAVQPRNKGQFSSGRSITATAAHGQTPMLPPAANVNYASQFLAIPNPVNGLFYNPDVAFLSNPENASRMIQDMAIFSALQERQLATAGLPWSIVPQDDEDPRQVEAADAIENIIRGRMPNIPDFFRNLLWSTWFGRMGAYIDYEWDYGSGKKQMVPCGWTPVHGDSIVFGDNGRIGYLVGVANGRDITVGVPGRSVMVGQNPTTDGQKWLAPEERKAWVVHHHEKLAGEFRIFTSAAAKYGLGLRSRLYPTWQLKQSALQFLMNAAEKFGSGWVIAYFDGSNEASRDAMRVAMQAQVGSTTMLIPRFAPEDQATEGLEVIDPPSGSEMLQKIIDYYDQQIRLTICGQTLTADNDGGTGLGSNVASVQESTFGRLIKYDAGALGETLTDQFVAVLQEFNGYDHLPPLRFQFSHDVGSTETKLANAKILHEIGVPLDHDELRNACGFTKPQEPQVNEDGSTDTTNLPATNEIDTEPLLEEQGNEREEAEE